METWDPTKFCEYVGEKPIFYKQIRKFRETIGKILEEEEAIALQNSILERCINVQISSNIVDLKKLPPKVGSTIYLQSLSEIRSSTSLGKFAE